MRGIVECINWMANNPEMELECVNGRYANRRMKDGVIECANENVGGHYWLTSDMITVFTKEDWQPYDPNPSVDFITAYEDCLKNGTPYYAEGDNAIQIKSLIGGVALDFRLHENKNTIGVIILNGFDWKKVK